MLSKNCLLVELSEKRTYNRPFCRPDGITVSVVVFIYPDTFLTLVGFVVTS